MVLTAGLRWRWQADDEQALVVMSHVMMMLLYCFMSMVMQLISFGFDLERGTQQWQPQQPQWWAVQASDAQPCILIV
jgi:hypothetical protein